MAEMDNFSQQVQGGAQQAAQQQMPLALRAMSAAPFQFGMTQLSGWNAQRYSNTMFGGGVLDTATGATGKRAAVKNFLGRRTGAYAGNAMQDNTKYAFGKSILGNDRSIFGKKPFGSGRKLKAMAANAPLNPTTFFRFDSVARLAGAPGDAATYSPFGTGMNMISQKALGGKGRIGNFLRGKYTENYDAADNLLPGKEIYSGGLFGRINTMGKVMDYEKQVSAASRLTGSPASYSRGEARIASRGAKAAAKLEKFDDSLIKLGRATGAEFAKTGATQYATSVASSVTGIGPIGSISDDVIGGILKTGAADAQIGAAAQNIGRTKALSQTMRGFVPRGIFESTATLSGRGAEMVGTRGFNTVANTFAKAMEGSRMGFSAGAMGSVDTVGHFTRTAYGGAGYMDDAMNLLKSNNVSAIRGASTRLGMDAFARKEFGTAAKMAGKYAGTFAPFASKALGAFGTASMVYDIGKGVGKMIMGGVNLGKDALKSMQGSLNKPLFGAGFKDNEVAATSRSRGVMAIQNSRLNARSSLGSEGAMMAAHFG